MDEPLKGPQGTPPVNDGSAPPSTTPQPAPPSFGLPPETPIMPGTSDHHIEPVPIPPSSIDIEPLAPTRKTAPTPPPVSNVILPQHTADPAPNTTPLPPFPNTTQVPPPPEPTQQTQPAQPLRTSMYDADVRGVSGASPKDYGIIEQKNFAPKIPPLPSEQGLASPTPQQPRAQDMLYESSLGRPLEGPVIPSTRRAPELQRSDSSVPPGTTPQNTPQNPTATRLNPSVLETPPTPSEMVRDAAVAGTVPHTPAEAANELARHTAIRTLESDVATTVAKNRMSVSSIALAQQKERLTQTLDEGVSEKKFSWWALAGIVLAVLGVGVVTVAYLMQTTPPESEPDVITTQDALIPNVSETTLDITGMKRSDILRALEALTTQYASRSGISLVRFITYRDEIVEEETVRLAGDVTAEQFLTQLSSRAGSRLARALGTQSFFGVVSVGGTATPFLVFEATSYDSAFAGMLEWEQFILDDVPFLTYTPPAPSPSPEPAVATTTATSTPTGLTASTTPASTSTPVTPRPAVVTITPTTPKFLDIVVQNRDARAVKNSDGSTKLLYAFPTPVILLIAQNEAALSAIVEHLTTARFSR